MPKVKTEYEWDVYHTHGEEWCSLKLLCGQCLQNEKRLLHRDCHPTKITDIPECDECPSRFKCWTSDTINVL
jgi:hypothetical protein